MRLLRRRNVPMFRSEAVIMLVFTLGVVVIGLLILVVRVVMRAAP
jgi:hypothetical protein